MPVGSWEEAFRTYHPLVRSYLRALTRDPATAEDLAQETFLRALEAWDGLRQETSLKPWLLAIARNLGRDHLRRHAATRRGQDALCLEPPGEPAPLVLESLERREMSQCVQERLAELPARHQEPLILADLLGLGPAEAAQILGITPGAAKVRLHRARRALGRILERACSFERDHRGVLVCQPRRVPARESDPPAGI
ncbi:MAG: RNA polymerase sigma factor [Deltaproteobacteria bacterium]|nr:RNA polymerase sigma factor [Deltaproteobacteria bacterium]